MGVFHLNMVYMAILNRQAYMALHGLYGYFEFGEAGLKDALIQVSVVAEGSIDAALNGKQYN